MLGGAPHAVRPLSAPSIWKTFEEGRPNAGLRATRTRRGDAGYLERFPPGFELL
jgi:hypothetical protein